MHAVAHDGCVQVRARALPTLLHHAQGLQRARRAGAIFALRVRGAGALRAGRRGAGVAAAAGGRHRAVRRSARGVHPRVRTAAALQRARRAGCAGRRALRARAAPRCARPDDAHGARVRRAPRRDGVARRRAARPATRRCPALRPLRCAARLQPLWRLRAAQAGASDVHVLLGATADRDQHPGAARRATSRVLNPFRKSSRPNVFRPLAASQRYMCEHVLRLHTFRITPPARQQESADFAGSTRSQKRPERPRR